MDLRFSTTTVSEVTGASVRQLDHWARTGVLRPSGREAAGRGTRRGYTFRDLVAAKALVRLRAENVSLQMLRKVVRKLKGTFPDESEMQVLGRLTLMSDGTRVYILQADEQKAVEIISRQYIWTVPVGRIIRDMREKVRHLPMEWTEAVKVRGRTHHLRIVRDTDSGGFVAQCRELPGALEQGDSFEEAVENGKAAIESVLEFQAKRAALTGRGRGIRAESAG